METAASNEQVHVLQWHHANRIEGCRAHTLLETICDGHLGVVQWIMKTPMGSAEPGENDALLIDAAAAHGIDIVRWLHEKRSTSCSSLAVNDTAESGYVEIVKYMLKNRSKGCTRAATQGAASYGHFKALKYMSSLGLQAVSTLLWKAQKLTRKKPNSDQWAMLSNSVIYRLCDSYSSTVLCVAVSLP